MDGLIATIIAGVVVTVVGAIVAFYFGGVREKQRQVHESQLEAQRQREETQRQREEAQREERDRQLERQQELSMRRTQTVSEILVRAHEIVTNTRALGETAARLPAKEADAVKEAPFFARSPDSKTNRLVQDWAEIQSEFDSILRELQSLRSYYLSQEPYLLPTTHDLFKSFERDIDKRLTPLSAHLADRQALADLLVQRNYPRSGTYWPFTAASRDLAGKVANLQQKSPDLIKAAEYARDLDFREYQTSFNKEVERASAPLT